MAQEDASMLKIRQGYCAETQACARTKEILAESDGTIRDVKRDGPGKREIEFVPNRNANRRLNLICRRMICDSTWPSSLPTAPSAVSPMP